MQWIRTRPGNQGSAHSRWHIKTGERAWTIEYKNGKVDQGRSVTTLCYPTWFYLIENVILHKGDEAPGEVCRTCMRRLESRKRAGRWIPYEDLVSGVEDYVNLVDAPGGKVLHGQLLTCNNCRVQILVTSRRLVQKHRWWEKIGWGKVGKEGALHCPTCYPYQHALQTGMPVYSVNEGEGVKREVIEA